jgi:hypothetical protein
MSNSPKKTNRLYKIVIATVAIFMIVSMIAAAIR